MAAVISLRRSQSENDQQPLPIVRQTVRDLLLSSAAYHSLDPEQKQQIAKSLVTVCQTAVSLLKEEAKSDDLVAAQSLSAPAASSVRSEPWPWLKTRVKSSVEFQQSASPEPRVRFSTQFPFHVLSLN